MSFLSSNLRIHLGEHDLRKIDQGEQLSRAIKVIRHPEFEPVTLKNDIMLLRLDAPARLSKSIQIIPMAKDCVSVGTHCGVSGWGTTTYPAGKGKGRDSSLRTSEKPCWIRIQAHLVQCQVPHRDPPAASR